MKKIIALLLFTTFGYSQTYTPVRNTLHDGIKLKTPPTTTGATSQLVRDANGVICEQIIAPSGVASVTAGTNVTVTGTSTNPIVNATTLVDASETVAGKVSVGTQTFGGNKTIVGESATVGNAFEVQNLAHQKTFEVLNKQEVIITQKVVNNNDTNTWLRFFGYNGENARFERVATSGTSIKFLVGGVSVFYCENVGNFYFTRNLSMGANTLFFSSQAGNDVSLLQGVIRTGSVEAFTPCLKTINAFLTPFLYVNVGQNNREKSAVMQSDSTTGGFLMPRMTSAQRLAIATPAIGLQVYQTDGTEGIYINKSTGWIFAY